MLMTILSFASQGDPAAQGLSLLGTFKEEWYLLLPLVAASVAIVMIGVERFLFVRKAAEQALALKEQVFQLAAGGAKPQEIVTVAGHGFAGGIYKALYEGPFHQQVTAAAMERARVADVAVCKRGLWFVGSMGNLAPFFGLFGTVIGIIQAFRKIAESGSGGFAVVSKGISTALVTTAAGIFVGIIAVFVFNYLNVLVGKLAVSLKNNAEEAYEARLIKLSQAKAAAGGAPQRRMTDVSGAPGTATA